MSYENYAGPGVLFGNLNPLTNYEEVKFDTTFTSLSGGAYESESFTLTLIRFNNMVTISWPELSFPSIPFQTTGYRTTTDLPASFVSEGSHFPILVGDLGAVNDVIGMAVITFSQIQFYKTPDQSSVFPALSTPHIKRGSFSYSVEVV